MSVTPTVPEIKFAVFLALQDSCWYLLYANVTTDQSIPYLWVNGNTHFYLRSPTRQRDCNKYEIIVQS